VNRVLSLSDLQDRFARAVIMGDVEAVSQYLVGGPSRAGARHSPRHQKRASLLRSATNSHTAWLGEPISWLLPLVIHTDFDPTMRAEWRRFPEFLSARSGRDSVSEIVADLERAFEVSIAIDLPPLN
jgi:hypothetical protein